MTKVTHLTNRYRTEIWAGLTPPFSAPGTHCPPPPPQRSSGPFTASSPPRPSLHLSGPGSGLGVDDWTVHASSQASLTAMSLHFRHTPYCPPKGKTTTVCCFHGCSTVASLPSAPRPPVELLLTGNGGDFPGLATEEGPAGP